jgi:hypothetical protein
MTTTTRVCTRCLEEKEITEFNFKDKRRGRRQIYCRDCTREQVRGHYHANIDYYLRKALQTKNNRKKGRTREDTKLPGTTSLYRLWGSRSLLP